MSKQKSVYICSSCGHIEPKWLGQCPSCAEWNTMEERIGHPSGKKPGAGGRFGHRQEEGASSRNGALHTARALSEVAPTEADRVTTGISELDRALGGGFMPGSTVLVGGEPGIGKSTLLLQAAARLGSVLYVSGEEASAQIRNRADRLGVDGSAITLLCSSNLEQILGELDAGNPDVVMIDSIQTVIAAEAGSVPGTPNQIKYAAHEIGEWARDHGKIAVLVAHVTKEGQIAGPKVIEHMVDAVLLFEHSGGELRFLRATKNRFGAIEEVGLFTMEESGLQEVRDPARVFLAGADGKRPAGVAVAPCFEGTRVLVIEIQALTVAAKGSVSRTFSDRIDPRRVSRIAAILEKHLGLQFSDQDIYVNVAGGIRIVDVGVDLSLALALYSARTGLAIPEGLIATGELTLAGELRSVSHLRRRIKAATDLGFSRVIGPGAKKDAGAPEREYRPTDSIQKAVRAVFMKTAAESQ